MKVAGPHAGDSDVDPTALFSYRILEARRTLHSSPPWCSTSPARRQTPQRTRRSRVTRSTAVQFDVPTMRQRLRK